MPLEIQIRLSFDVSLLFCFFESSTFFHRLAILLATSFRGGVVFMLPSVRLDIILGLTGRVLGLSGRLFELVRDLFDMGLSGRLVGAEFLRPR